MKILYRAIISLTLLTFCSAFAEVSVIVNSNVADTIEDKDIAKIFLGKNSKLPSGSTVVPVNLSEGDNVRVEFDKSVLNKSAGQIKSYWSQQMFTGKGKPPEEMQSEQDVVNKVMSDESAIGYVSPDAVTPDVRVIGTY